MKNKKIRKQLEAVITEYTGTPAGEANHVARQIMADFVLIPRSELPPVEEHHEEGVIAVDGSTFWIDSEDFAKNALADIINDIAAIEYVKAGGKA